MDESWLLRARISGNPTESVRAIVPILTRTPAPSAFARLVRPLDSPLDRPAHPMYEHYWGLSESPFRNDADPGRFYESPGRSEALARLFFLIEEAQPAGVVTGPEGTGKSAVLRLLKRNVERSRRAAALLDLDGLDAQGFAWRLASELRLGMRPDADIERCWRTIDDALQGTGWSRRRTVVLIDHPESADPSCARSVERLIAAARRSPGGITVLVAARDSGCDAIRPLRRLAPLRVEIPPFDQEQTERYVVQSLREAGSARAVFAQAALRAVFERTRGVPRLVNQLCELSLLAAMYDERAIVESDVVLGAASEMSLSA